MKTGGSVLFLNLFPIPRHYERIPGALAFALTAAMVLYFVKEGSSLSLALLLASVVLLVLVYLIRYRQKQEWIQFFNQENQRLLEMKGAQGPSRYIPDQRAEADRLRNPELKTTALLNLSTALLANGQPADALETLDKLNPLKMPNPTLRLVYWTQRLGAALQQGAASEAENAYAAAIATMPEVSDMLKISFMPSEIQYRLFRGEYKLALDQLGEIPEQELDEASRDLLTVLRITALRGVGAAEKADKLTAQVEKHDLLPSTRLLLHRAASIQKS